MATLTKGSRIAIVSPLQNRWSVYVGYRANVDCPGEETIPARWFKGFSTCSAHFATEKTALKKAQEFLDR